MARVVREPYGFVHVDPSPLKDVYGGRVYDVVWRKQSEVMSAFAAGTLRALAFVAQG